MINEPVESAAIAMTYLAHAMFSLDILEIAISCNIGQEIVVIRNSKNATDEKLSGLALSTSEASTTDNIITTTITTVIIHLILLQK